MKTVPPWLRTVGILLLLVLLIVGIAALGRRSPEHTAIKQIEKPNQQAVERIGIPTTPSYRDKLEIYGQQRVSEAQENGTSYVPPLTKPSPKKSKAKAPPQQHARIQQPSAKSSRMEACLRGAFHADFGQQGYIAGVRESVPAPKPQEARVRKLSLSPGDILYAVNRTALTSDAPGPVLAEVVEGPLAKAKVIGSFQQANDHLTLIFTELITPDGSRHGIKAYGIDPMSDRTAIASRVDHHYLERFGSLFAASFLEGLGGAVRASGTERYPTIYGSSTRTPIYSLQDEALIALGKVGERAATHFQQHTTRPPTVTLDAGIGLGIFLIAVDEDRRPS